MGVSVNPNVSGVYNPSLFFKSSIPIISCSTGNIGNNGALTAITALPTTYSGGAWVNLPAGAIAAGVPAAQTSYWAVFSTTQAATVYNNIQPATGFPTPPASPTAFVTTGPGAFTGITAATTFLTIPLPGGSIGSNGQLRISAGGSFTASTGTKTLTGKLASTSFITPAFFSGGSTNAFLLNGIISNVNAQNSNKAVSGTISNSTAVGVVATATYGAVDTSLAQNITFVILNNTATDNFVLEDVLIEILSDGT
jgi:hypothetical protein